MLIKKKGVSSKVVFRTIKDLDNFLTPLENIIRFRFDTRSLDRNWTTLNDVSWLCQSNMVDLLYKRRSQVPIRNQLRCRIVEQSEEPVDFESSEKLIRSKMKHRQGYYEKIYRNIRDIRFHRLNVKLSKSQRVMVLLDWLLFLWTTSISYSINKNSLMPPLWDTDG